MKKLLNYLRALDRDARAEFVQRCGTSENYLRKASSTGQRLGAELCVLIERESKCAVTRQELRPMDFGRVWPELVAAEHVTESTDA